MKNKNKEISQSKDGTDRRTPWENVIAVAAVLFLVASITVFAVVQHRQAMSQNKEESTAGEEPEDMSASGTDTAATETVETDTVQDAAEPDDDKWYSTYCTTPDKIINFEALREKCPDVYAWITIPGTSINYPISYNDATDPFYWNHDIDGNPDEKGMIITDSLNSQDFSDPMTLIYGKNPDDGTMFAELHEFKDKDFFDEHDTVKIYIDNAELDYKVYAEYTYPNKQILQAYNFSDPLSFTQYFDELDDIRDLGKNVNEANRPNYDDHVITLVTHTDNEDERLFVQAVLKTSNEAAE